MRLCCLVRLVRACGSKLTYKPASLPSVEGQARKSLWIETVSPFANNALFIGQARKSLWIETIQGCIDYAAGLGSGS